MTSLLNMPYAPQPDPSLHAHSKEGGIKKIQQQNKNAKESILYHTIAKGSVAQQQEETAQFLELLRQIGNEEQKILLFNLSNAQPETLEDLRKEELNLRWSVHPEEKQQTGIIISHHTPVTIGRLSTETSPVSHWVITSDEAIQKHHSEFDLQAINIAWNNSQELPTQMATPPRPDKQEFFSIDEALRYAIAEQQMHVISLVICPSRNDHTLKVLNSLFRVSPARLIINPLDENEQTLMATINELKEKGWNVRCLKKDIDLLLVTQKPLKYQKRRDPEINQVWIQDPQENQEMQHININTNVMSKLEKLWNEGKTHLLPTQDSKD